MNNKKVEETSVVANVAGHVAPPDDKQLDEELTEFVNEAEQEESLRETIRESLLQYSLKKKMLREELKKEETFRDLIKQIILQEKRSNLPPAESTLHGELRDFLTNSNATILGDMNSLATAPEEKKGFINDLLVGISSMFEIAMMNNQEDTQEQESPEIAIPTDLNEEEDEEKIIFSDPDEELRNGPIPDVEDPADEEKEDNIGSQSQEERGAKKAKITLKQIESNVKKMIDGLVVDEFESARDAVLRNIGAYIIKWSNKDPKITSYVTDTLDSLDSSLPEGYLDDDQSSISEPFDS